MAREKNMIPVQPYLILNAEDYKGIFAQKMGISGFYEFNVQSGCPNVFQAVPDGSTDLVFGIGEKDVKLYLGGTVLKAKQWEFEEGRTYFGARFLPGKCVLPQGMKIKEVVDKDLEIPWNEYGSELAERIAEGKSLIEKADSFFQCFPQHIKVGEKENICAIEQYVRRRIYEKNGNITIKELAGETGYSECYIRRSFEQIHGISPKVFERFVRFQNMLREIGENTESVDIEQIALECGYYDQSHMMKDFKSFTGTTPEQYRKMLLEKKYHMIGGEQYGIIKD